MNQSQLYISRMREFRAVNGLPINDNGFMPLGLAAFIAHFEHFVEEYYEGNVACVKHSLDNVYENPLNADNPLQCVTEIIDAYLDMNIFCGGAIMHVGLHNLYEDNILPVLSGDLGVIMQASEMTNLFENEDKGEYVRLHKSQRRILEAVFIHSMTKVVFKYGQYKRELDTYIMFVDTEDGSYPVITREGEEVFMALYNIVMDSNMSKLCETIEDAKACCAAYDEKYYKEWIIGETGLDNPDNTVYEKTSGGYAIYRVRDRKLLKGNRFVSPETRLMEFIGRKFSQSDLDAASINSDEQE